MSLQKTQWERSTLLSSDNVPLSGAHHIDGQMPPVLRLGDMACDRARNMSEWTLPRSSKPLQAEDPQATGCRRAGVSHAGPALLEGTSK